MRYAFSILAILGIAIPLAAQTPTSDLEAVVATSEGTFRFEFAADKAPKHVDQFIDRARKGYYDGSAFFRVVANGMIQGGDPVLKDPKTTRNLYGTGGLNLLPDEFSDMKLDRGVVAAVSIPNKANSDGAQFFVLLYPQPTMDGKFSAFGRITEGIEVAQKISQMENAPDGFLAKPVRIEKIAIERKRVEPFLNATPDEMRRTVTMRTTLGTIQIRLQPDWAPNNARRFLMLTEAGWFNGTDFHRVVKGFVAQGGMPDRRASGPVHPADRWITPVKGEFRNDVKHTRGIVSMARGEDPDSGETSFFLVLADAPHLDGQYSAFGQVIEGLDVLDAFGKEEVDGEKPKRRLEIIEATVDPK